MRPLPWALLRASAAVLALAPSPATAESAARNRTGTPAQARPAPSMTPPRAVLPMSGLSLPPLGMERRTFPNNPHAKIQR